ncbi:uncharacterized protein LOC114759113 [Neltuma alba]|uniref:uncharacterized protein LOC114759113 n=1 Tax=Neltuma alba TaxID=207710 RepID=UPI0010A3CC59|nr:uncharacterized protein LOC114759113 [Prosopis alba]
MAWKKTRSQNAPIWSINSLFLMMDKAFLVWNCQGATSSKFHVVLKSLLQGYGPYIIVLVEPRIFGTKADRVIRKIGYTNSHRVEATGFSGVVNKDKGSKTLFTTIYGSPNPMMQERMWIDLLKLPIGAQKAWLLAGDFNATLNANKRKGGAIRLREGCKAFRTFTQRLGLMDLGFTGPKYTWKRRSLMVRLDRALCNNNWLQA